MVLRPEAKGTDPVSPPRWLAGSRRSSGTRRTPHAEGVIEQGAAAAIPLGHEFAIELRDAVAALLPAILQVRHERLQGRRREASRPWRCHPLVAWWFGRGEQ